jgi:hypothetical protein
VVNKAKPDAVKPASAAKKISANVLVGKEINDRLDLQAKHIDFHHVTESSHRSDSGPEFLRLTRLNVNIQQVSMFALK